MLSPHMLCPDYLHAGAIVFPLVFFAGIVDSMAGGGGLISLPAYLAAGVPPHLALGTNKFSSVFGTFSATIRYFRHHLIDLPVAVAAAIFALAGSYFGTRAVLLIDPHFLNYLLLTLIPIITIISLLERHQGEEDHSAEIPWRHRVRLGALGGLVVGFYDGFFGPGSGTFLILFFTAALRYDFVFANGNTKVVNLASNIGSVVTFIAHGSVWYWLGLPAALFGIAGNLVGSKWVLKGGSKAIRPVFVGVLLLLLAKVIYNLATHH